MRIEIPSNTYSVIEIELQPLNLKTKKKKKKVEIPCNTVKIEPQLLNLKTKKKKKLTHLILTTQHVFMEVELCDHSHQQMSYLRACHHRAVRNPSPHPPKKQKLGQFMLPSNCTYAKSRE